MTPAEHIARAEELAHDAELRIQDGFVETAQRELLLGILHALIALAVEGGVPHSTTTPPAV